MSHLKLIPMVNVLTITTLYDLIETLQGQVESENDAVVTEVVAHLSNSGYIRVVPQRARRSCVDSH